MDGRIKTTQTKQKRRKVGGAHPIGTGENREVEEMGEKEDGLEMAADGERGRN